MKRSWVRKLTEFMERGRLIELAAEKQGLDVQEWMRQVLNRAAKRVLGGKKQ